MGDSPGEQVPEPTMDQIDTAFAHQRNADDLKLRPQEYRVKPFQAVPRRQLADIELRCAAARVEYGTGLWESIRHIGGGPAIARFRKRGPLDRSDAGLIDDGGGQRGFAREVCENRSRQSDPTIRHIMSR